MNTLQAWQVETGDFVIIDGEECEVQADAVTDDENVHLVNIRVFNHSENDVEVKPVVWDEELEVWNPYA